jgi:hypothetical protein
VNNLYKEYDRIVAVGEKSAGNEQIGDMWLETKTFNKSTPVGDIVDWAKDRGIGGKLIITIDESSIKQEVKNDK